MRMRKKILSIAAALCIAGCMVCIPDYSEADAASGYVVENLIFMVQYNKFYYLWRNIPWRLLR